MSNHYIWYKEIYRHKSKSLYERNIKMKIRNADFSDIEAIQTLNMPALLWHTTEILPNGETPIHRNL